VAAAISCSQLLFKYTLKSGRQSQAGKNVDGPVTVCSEPTLNQHAKLRSAPLMPSKRSDTRKRWLRRAVLPGLLLLAVLLWSGWASRNPERERDLRSQLQEQLEDRFPVAMQPHADRYGIFRQTASANHWRPVRILLVHGLDEPGNIWKDLLPVLDAAGFDSWEFRYPNDQGIDRSADLLAASWSDLPADRPLVLLGHSMGGLVIRDFVSRWRHPVDTSPQIEGAQVLGVILAGPPNQGSNWAQLRVLLELRDQWAAGRQAGFAPLAGLQDGTGAAKIDLQPGSSFLAALNARPWPQVVQLRIIGGVLRPSAPALGDGVVATNSLMVAGSPAPILVTASHRGMLSRLFASDAEPPAIPVIMSLLEEFAGRE
jgi:pimeloyl-ACP methyl ester carboxylesterase